MAMAASSAHNLLVEQSYSNIISTVRSMPLNYNIVETPISMYLTVRKSLIKSAQISASPETLVEKFKKLEEANQILKTDVEEAVNESEEKSKRVSQLEERIKGLLE